MEKVDETKSRHPKIQYWFWNTQLLDVDKIKEQLDVLVKESDFNTVFLTERTGVNFYDKALKPYFKEAVEHAHQLGLKILMQLWVPGHMNEAHVDISEAAALVAEAEGQVTDGTITLSLESTQARFEEFAAPISCELLKAYAFKKVEEGIYENGTLVDITEKAVITEKGKKNMTLHFELPEYNGHTVYVMTANYYHYADFFGERLIRDFTDIMEYYRDVKFDGFVVDELRNMNIKAPWQTEEFRERFYGRSFKAYFEKQTEKDLDQTLFEMRYCTKDTVSERIAAINLYFDIFRHSTKRIEEFMAHYNEDIYGEKAFFGLHNTYHNRLQSDEIWMTGCNWWEVPRQYAQTDEDITFPVRMGIACQASEPFIYDMWYHKEQKTFIEKAMRDASFGCRIHYHAMNDGSLWGTDTGSSEFLEFIRPYEDKITLLNQFEPSGLPHMELLVVFGFPALCNWYPDVSARHKYDINGKLDIEKRVDKLWKNGYLNALAPSDAIVDGRIALKDGKYDYCGHTFDKLLYLYPEYSKKEVSDFLEIAAIEGYELKIIGEYTHTFEGQTVKLNVSEDVFLDETADIVKSLDLKKNPIENGCVLEDGSVIISDYDSVMTDSFCTYHFELNGHSYEAEFRGTFALKTDESGNVEKITAGNLKYLKKDGHVLISGTGIEDYVEV